MLILKGDFGFLGRFYKTSETVQQKQGNSKPVSSACSSQDSHARHWQRPKPSLSQQAPALCDRRGRRLPEGCGTPSASCSKALAEEVTPPSDVQRTRRGTCAGRSKTSEISDRRGIWLHSNVQHCSGDFLQKKEYYGQKERTIKFIFNHGIQGNVEAAKDQYRAAQGRQVALRRLSSPLSSSHLYSDSIKS